MFDSSVSEIDRLLPLNEALIKEVQLRLAGSEVDLLMEAAAIAAITFCQDKWLIVEELSLVKDGIKALLKTIDQAGA